MIEVNPDIAKVEQAPAPKKLSPKQKVLERLDDITKMARIACTDSEIAVIIGVGEATLQRYARDALTLGRAEIRKSLRRLQWKACLAGNVKMQMWLGQQYLGQRREQHNVESGDNPVLAARIKEMMEAELAEHTSATPDEST